MELGAVGYIGAEEAALFVGGGVGGCIAGIGFFAIVVVVAPLRLELLVWTVYRWVGSCFTKWLANSRPGRLAEAYSKSITISCLCSFAGSNKGDSPLGSILRRFPYCVLILSV